MTEEAAIALEATITDVGALLVDLERYHPTLTEGAERLRQAALRLGDRARRRHHAGLLDTADATILLAEAQQLLANLGGALTHVRASPTYGAARAAYVAGDLEALGRLLPVVFTDLEPVAEPPALYWSVPWRRRNRPRPSHELVDDLRDLALRGIPAETDPLAAGTDAVLAAVALRSSPSPDDPIVLEFAAATLPRPLARSLDRDEFFAATPRLRAPFTVLLRAALDDDQIEATPVDYPAFRRDLEAALSAAAVPYRLV